MAVVVAGMERTETDSIALVDSDTATLLYWSGEIDDPETASTLAQFAERRQEIARAEAGVSDLMRDLDGAAASQARIRENLAAVPGDSTLAQRYIAMLEEEEDRIAELENDRQEAERGLAQLREAFARSVQDL